MAKRVDWSFVKPLYVAGGLSNREIANQYNDAHTDQNEWKETITEAAIRKQSKSKGWKKSLADRVKRQVREKMVRGEFANGKTANNANQEEIDDQIVDQAAETMIQVINLHRKDIEALKELEADLIKRLRDDEDQVVIGWFQGEANEHIVKLGLDQRSKVFQRLVSAVGRRIQLERLAWGIDDKNSEKDLPDLIEVNQEF